MTAATDYAAQADDARERIASTIDELQDRLNPRRIVGDAVERVQAQGSEMLVQARDTLKAHPLAIVAVGAAIGVGLLTRSKIVNAKVDLGDDYQAYTDYDDDYAPPPEGMPVASAPRLTQPVGAERASRIAENPLVAILAGLAAGALIGALAPASESETSLWKSIGR